MPDQITSIPQLITAAADGADHEIEFHTNFNSVLGSYNQIAFIEVVSGTFKFNVGYPTTESNASYTATEKVAPVPFINGSLNLVYRCTSAGTFRISAV